MSEYAAVFKLGWLVQCFEGDEPREIIEEVEKVQDFECLLEMGRMNERGLGQIELDKLAVFLEKYHDDTLTMEDIKNFDITLSVGSLSCLGIGETESEIKALKAQYAK